MAVFTQPSDRIEMLARALCRRAGNDENALVVRQVLPRLAGKPDWLLLGAPAPTPAWRVFVQDAIDCLACIAELDRKEA